MNNVQPCFILVSIFSIKLLILFSVECIIVLSSNLGQLFVEFNDALFVEIIELIEFVPELNNFMFEPFLIPTLFIVFLLAWPKFKTKLNKKLNKK